MTTNYTQMAENAPNNWSVFNNLSKGLSVTLSVDCAAGGTVVVDADLYKVALVLKLTGAPAADFQLDIPNGERLVIVQNQAGKTATVDTIGNAAVPAIVRHGASAVLYVDSGDDLPINISYGGLQMLRLPAALWAPTVTAGSAAIASFETTAGNPDIRYLAFDTTTIEHAQALITMPPRWDGGVLFFRVSDAIPGGQTGGLDGRVWELAARSLGADESFDQAFGSYVGVTIDDASIETRQRSAMSAAVTAAGTPAGGELLCLDLRRKRDDAADDLDTDAWFVELELYWLATKGTDE